MIVWCLFCHFVSFVLCSRMSYKIDDAHDYCPFFFRLYFSMHFCVDRALLYLFEIPCQNVSDVRSNLKLEVSITQWTVRSSLRRLLQPQHTRAVLGGKICHAISAMFTRHWFSIIQLYLADRSLSIDPQYSKGSQRD